MDFPTWTALETERKALIDRIRLLPPSVQSSPVGKSYSPIQMIEHMAIVEQFSLNLMLKQDASGFANKNGEGNFILKLVERQLGKPGKTIPAGGPLNPAPGTTLDGGIEHWDQVRAKISAHLESFGADQVVCKHPLFGYLSKATVVRQMAAHQGYHRDRTPVMP